MLLALFAGVFRYVDQHFHTPETFFENTSELATNADIRERLFNGFRTEIIAFADGDVAEEPDTGTGGFLDDEEEVVLDPITEERIARDQAIEAVLLDVFDSNDYDQAFAAALTRTQTELITSAELEPEALLRNKGEVFFNMQPLYEPIWEQLRANPATTEITQAAPPAGYGVFKVADRETTMNFLWTLLRNGPNWRGLTMLGAIASFIGAVAIADRRPSTAIQFGGGMVGVGVVLIVIIYLIRFVVPLLAGGGSSANPVVAVYAANLAPLVSIMIRLVIFGVVVAAIGGITKLIWPDDWVYSSVSDERGVRSIRRRRGAPEADQPAPQQQLQPAAMAPGYAGYPQQQPYPGYPQQWGQPQPYPGQYPPGYPQPYPAGPYAQPAQPMQQSQPQHYTSPGKPTVPVMPVQIGQPEEDLVPPAAPPFDAAPGGLPPDAAQAVPRVVATADTTLDASANAASTAKETVVEAATTQAATTQAATAQAAAAPADEVAVEALVDDAEPAADTESESDTDDEWSGEKDW